MMYPPEIRQGINQLIHQKSGPAPMWHPVTIPLFAEAAGHPAAREVSEWWESGPGFVAGLETEWGLNKTHGFRFLVHLCMVHMAQFYTILKRMF